MSDPKMVIVVRRDLNMRKGKLASQCAHAACYYLLKCMDHLLDKTTADWINSGQAKIVVGCDTEQELLELIQKATSQNIVTSSVIDQGRTEFHGVETLTCCAFGPDLPEKLDPILGHLKLQ